jgi:hypothetical protein
VGGGEGDYAVENQQAISMQTNAMKGLCLLMAVLCWVMTGVSVVIAVKTATPHIYLEALFMVFGGFWVRKHGHERAG